MAFIGIWEWLKGGSTGKDHSITEDLGNHYSISLYIRRERGGQKKPQIQNYSPISLNFQQSKEKFHTFLSDMYWGQVSKHRTLQFEELHTGPLSSLNIIYANIQNQLFLCKRKILGMYLTWEGGCLETE